MAREPTCSTFWVSSALYLFKTPFFVATAMILKSPVVYEVLKRFASLFRMGSGMDLVNSKLNKEERIIVRIIKPLVKFKGEQIQAAQVDVANGI